MHNVRCHDRLWDPLLSTFSKPAQPEVCLDYASDPVRFCQEQLDFRPDDRQRQILTAKDRQIIICASRQWGKSTVTAAKAFHHAWFTPDTLVLVLSPCERQSAEFIRKVETFARRFGIKPKGDGDNACSMILPNGTRIVGLPGTEATDRGFSAPTLILIDEAARVDDSLYYAVRPMLAASNGQMILMSTPMGQRGFFHKEWSGDDQDWLRVKVPATECPRITKELLARERKRLTDQFFRQEFLCEFQASEEALFNPDQVWAILDPTIPAL